MPQNVVLLMMFEHKVAQHHDLPLNSGLSGHLISCRGEWSYRLCSSIELFSIMTCHPVMVLQYHITECGLTDDA